MYRTYALLALTLSLVACCVQDSLADVSGTLNDSQATKATAEELLKHGGIRRGVCVVLGPNENLTGSLAIELARVSEMFVHVRTPDAADATQKRRQADEAGFAIDRIAVEQGDVDRLPYADNIVDLLVSTKPLDSLKLNEVVRVLRPLGKAFILQPVGRGTPAERPRAQAPTEDFHMVRVSLGSGRSWLQLTKPTLAGAGQWSHWEHGPDNNPVSEDTIIKAPYMTQFLSKPYYIAMPSITTAAGGRTFLAIGHIAHHEREWGMMNKLIARNGYNGVELWRRDLPEGYLVHRSAFIATDDTFYMIDGDHCLLLDPKTGEEKGQIKIPDVHGEWKWMVMQDGVLYVLAGAKGQGVQTTKGDRAGGGWSWHDLSGGYYTKPRVPWGFGDTLAAYDIEGESLVWKQSEEHPIDARAMSLGRERLVLYCPEHHLRCRDLKSGNVIWTNYDQRTLELIEELGKGLTSTPGFRSACMAVHTPEAVVIQGQTRQNVVAVSTSDGSRLWTKSKVTNNPNAIFVDGNLVMGVGPDGNHVVIAPVTGEVLEDLQFDKTACTRLTASSDSFFVRGEGTLRFDRASKRVLVDGAVRPACNDGVLPANGLLYLGPWQCDCNLSLIGRVAKCSAGDFQFDQMATDVGRLELASNSKTAVTKLPVSPEDWPTYRGNNHRSASTRARVARSVVPRWQYVPEAEHIPTAPTSAGGLIFLSGEDGKVRALDATTGELKWQFATPSPIKMPPTIWEGRALIGSGDGHVYALEAATGELLWRFRAAPVERHIMVYGSLSSTWPVNSGVLVEDGVAYFAAGIIDHDGTYVFALDAKTGKIKWQNNSSGHLNEELRKGVSAQGILTVHNDRLLLAGGNQVSPAPFDLETGECLAEPFDQGRPKANHGQFVGMFGGKFPIVGGRILYSAPENVANKESFVILTGPTSVRINYGGIPPTWNEDTAALVNFKHGKVTCCDVSIILEHLASIAEVSPWDLSHALESTGAVRWQSDLGQSQKFEAISLVLTPDAAVAVVQHQNNYRAQQQWFVVALDTKEKGTLWRHEIYRDPLPGGLLIDKQGQVIVTMLDGSVHCLAAK